jgi:DNA topoisomerase-3
MSRPVLCVAQTDALGKTIAEVLSIDGYEAQELRPSRTRGYRFEAMIRDAPTPCLMFSLSSPLFQLSYGDNPPRDFLNLLSARLTATIPIRFHEIYATLTSLAADSHFLYLFLSNSQDGALIASDVVSVAQRNNNDLLVFRVVFNAASKSELLSAVGCAVPWDPSIFVVSNLCREVEFRIQSALTPVIQGLIGRLSKRPPRYLFSPASMSILAIIVDHFHDHLFVEPFHTVDCQITKDASDYAFKWRRKRLFCKLSCFALYSSMLNARRAAVEAIDEVQKTVPKPPPLTCSRMVALAARYLKLDPLIVLAAADTLYQGGHISYPFSDCDVYPPDFDYKKFITEMCGYGPVAQSASILGTSFAPPVNGETTNCSNVPVYPVRVPADLAKQSDEYKLFDFIARYFLASCSHDSVVTKAVVRICIGGEMLLASFPLHQDLNWLEIFPWATDMIYEVNPPPLFQAGEEIIVKSLRMVTNTPERTDGITDWELLDTCGGGRETVHELMRLKAQRLVQRTAAGTKPTSAGTAVVLALAHVGFDFQDRFLAKLVEELAGGDDPRIMAKNVLMAAAAVGIEVTERMPEIEAAFGAAAR